MPEKVTCPICSSDKAEAVRTAADIVRCQKCSIVYLRTRPTVQELEQAYQSYASNPGSHMKLPETIKQIQTSPLRRDYLLNQVMEHTGGPTGRMLDIGSGWGGFLINARSRGFSVSRTFS